FYFVHSYHVIPEDRSIIATTTDYEKPFVSSVAKENIFACQFHPEKSQQNGLRLFEAFSKV
ncbi:MAG: imidazole glycerol phosphate synthase subunit HisH, partial [bacterium]|nr:imidazole glycerol phosphate synthase subunit HisH [bacterium]